MYQHAQIAYYSYNPFKKSPTSSQNSPTGVIIDVAVVIIVILLVIITILSVLLVLKRKKQPPTVQCDKENMSEVHDQDDNIVKTNHARLSRIGYRQDG